MEIVCVNSTYSAEQIMLFKKYSIQIPELNGVYTIRELIKPSGKEGIGVLLEEIVNPKIPLKHPILGRYVLMEINWNINRFSTLSGEPLSREDIESIKQETTVKQIDNATDNSRVG